jgi:hypothetical protein
MTLQFPNADRLDTFEHEFKIHRVECSPFDGRPVGETGRYKMQVQARPVSTDFGLGDLDRRQVRIVAADGLEKDRIF